MDKLGATGSFPRGKVIVCGGRGFNDWFGLCATLDALHIACAFWR